MTNPDTREALVDEQKAQGMTCYERDEVLCEDQMCLRTGCRIRNEGSGRHLPGKLDCGVPVAWRWRTRSEENWTFSILQLALNDIGRTAPTFQEQALYALPRAVDGGAVMEALGEARLHIVSNRMLDADRAIGRAQIDIASAVKHIRDWTSYIDDHHRQKYADLIVAQAKLIAWFVNNRAALSLPRAAAGVAVERFAQAEADYIRQRHGEKPKLIADMDFETRDELVRKANYILAALPRVSTGGAAGEPDDLERLVERFSKRLLAKLKLARANGRSGWEKDDWEADCQRGLLRHIEKGDPRDVAAYCAFMDHHGWITKSASPLPLGAVGREEIIEECAKVAEFHFAGSNLNNIGGLVAQAIRALALPRSERLSPAGDK